MLNTEQANLINGAMVEAISTIQVVSPAVAVASIGLAGYQVYKDNEDSRWNFTKMAFRSLVPPREGVSRQVKKVVAVTAMTAVGLGLTSFAFGAEDAFRTGQSSLLTNVADQAGLDANDTIIVTQGGTDTIMDDSQVSKDVVEQVGGTGMFKSLPKVSSVDTSTKTTQRSENGADMDGILLSIPSLEKGTVMVTGLLDSKVGDEVSVGGKVLEVDKVLGKKNAPMRREVVITSEDEARRVLDPTDNGVDDDYFAAVVPGGNEDRIQSILDKKYGAGTFEAMTFREFDKGTSEFMANNATVILLLFALSMTAIGASYERAAIIDRIENKKKEISVLRAMGCDLDRAMKPEMIHTFMRLGASVPLAWLVANGFSGVANNINPGLNMDIDLAGDFTTAFALMFVTSVLLGNRAGKKLIKGITPSSAMREV